MGTLRVRLSLYNDRNGIIGFLGISKSLKHLWNTFYFVNFSGHMGFANYFSLQLQSGNRIVCGKRGGRSTLSTDCKGRGVHTGAVARARAGLSSPALMSSSYLVVRLLQGSQDVQYRLRICFQVIIHQGVDEHRTTV